MLLSEIIIEQIKNQGLMSFRDFMEMVLYYPELGYYNSKQNIIGAEGDFYTNASLSASFGVMLGRQIEEMWKNLGKKALRIIEYGAGTGLLCHDILDYLKNNADLYNDCSYSIIEKSSSMREIEKKHLHEKVSWHSSIQEIPQMNTCILSNELVDNFAVHQVVMQDQLMEVFVDYENGFKEVLQPANPTLLAYFEALNVTLPKGFRTEINLEATTWIKEIAQWLKKGYVITIDYGALSSEMYKINKCLGTLLCYNKHQINDNPYQFIGEQDITTHTNFSALKHWGSKYGLKYRGLVNQTSFLLGLGFKEYQDTMLKEKISNAKLALEESIINYRLLMDLGTKIKVLIQQKGVSDYPLSGLKFLNPTPNLP
ncbi:class I SAM-dependent methyltransferase [Flavobacterium aestivum]|uniref:class I SAM-dependent methyltransferase n=1 Tax=Flavobacterium aestivum TaxID=3003257 RepID=UPI0022869AB2|nr:SAM-dependent methyltransferase [Flavobacterium aestivum]